MIAEPIKCGADVHARSKCNRTILSYAAAKGLMDAELTNHGVDIAATDLLGETGLSDATFSNVVKVVTALIQHSVAVN